MSDGSGLLLDRSPDAARVSLGLVGGAPADAAAGARWASRSSVAIRSCSSMT